VAWFRSGLETSKAPLLISQVIGMDISTGMYGVHDYDCGFSVILPYSFTMILTRLPRRMEQGFEGDAPMSETGIMFCHVMP
jgi:hypothetical protein